MPEQSPVPSPWKSLQRTSIRTGLALLALIAIWSLWYGYAAWRFAQLKSQLQAHNDSPTQASQEQTVAPQDDAVYLATRDMAVLSLSTAEGERIGQRPESPSPADDLTENSLAEKQKPLAVDLALASTKASHWHASNPFDPASFDQRILQLSVLSAIRSHAAVAAQRHHLDQQALQAIDDVETCSRITDEGPDLAFHTNVLSFEERALRALAWIAPDIQLRSPSRPGGANRDFILHLMGRLQNQTSLNHGMERALESMEDVIIQPDDLNSYPFYIRPSVKLDAIAAMRSQAQLRNAFGTSSVSILLSMATENMDPFSHQSSLWIAAHVGRGILRPPLNKRDFLLRHFIVETMRNAAALRLALRLYELDHGTLPDRLDALVPDYIKALPKDIFRADGKTLGYSRTKLFLYSVGSDGVDDQGHSAAWSGTINLDDWFDQPNDLVFHLDRQTIPPLPAE
jgi:hypothetical protein